MSDNIQCFTCEEIREILQHWISFVGCKNTTIVCHVYRHLFASPLSDFVHLCRGAGWLYDAYIGLALL